jgi:hypothetical protein
MGPDGMGRNDEPGASAYAGYMYELEAHGIPMVSSNIMNYEPNDADSGLVAGHYLERVREIDRNEVARADGTTRMAAATGPPQLHSLAIPISGRRSPINCASSSTRYVPTSAIAAQQGIGSNARLGGNIASSMGACLASSPGGQFFSGSLGTPGAPMPSPIIGGHDVSGTNSMNAVMGNGRNNSMGTFTIFPGNQYIDESFSPCSPPLAKSHMIIPQPKAAHNMAASPRSLSESMFSFRAGSLTTAEQQIEKQRRRKENHNAVERRRRDLINIMISRLALLVTANSSGLDIATASKMNKGEVLEASVKRLLLINQLGVELAEQLASVDPSNVVLRNHEDLLRSLITVLPEGDSIAGTNNESS